MYVAIRDDIVSWIGFKDVVAGVKDLGLKSFELNVGRDLKSKAGFDLSTEKSRKDVVNTLKSKGVQICALLVANNFAKEDAEAEIKWVVDSCVAASSIGADAVRIDSPHRAPNATMEQYTERTVKCVREVLERTKDLEIPLGMENHGVVGNDRNFVREVLETVNSERMGLTLDAGNFYWSGYPLSEVYEIIESFAQYAKHTHFKNLSFSKERQQIRRQPGEGYPKTGAPLYSGDIDLGWVVKKLKKSGYDGDLTVEDESLSNFPQEQRVDIVRKDIEFMKRLV